MGNVLWLRQKLPKVNKELALKLMEEGDDEAELASRKKKGKVGEHTGGYKNQVFISAFQVPEFIHAEDM